MQREEINAVFGLPNGGEPGIPPSAEDISVFLIAYILPINSAQHEKPLPIACGALRVLPQSDDTPGDVEIKRMYVHRAYRGHPWNAAKAILSALEDRARENGWIRVVLETGNLLTAAIRFYTREGYVPVKKFGAYRDNEASLCFGKVLT
jgi:GNAT superfamily N-acetyltransferase